MVHVDLQLAEGVEPPFDDAWFNRVAQAAVAAAKPDAPAAPVATDAEIVLLLADDATLHDLNRRFRGQDKPTDVLSFEGDAAPAAPGTTPAPAGHHLGDIAISVERARRQAEDYGHSVERELAYLLTHGALHLLGYDHENDDDQRLMRDAEERALIQIGLTREPGAAGEASSG